MDFTDMRFEQRIATYDCRIVEDIHLTVLVEDWSGCRSPSRARRRLKAGHPQRRVMRMVPDPAVYQMKFEGREVMVMHPETARALERHMAKTAARIQQKMLLDVFGSPWK